MSKTTTTPVPSRASKPVPVPDVEQEEYDDNSMNQMPRSALRMRSTKQPETKTRTTDILATPLPTRQVTGSTRVLLWVVLVLCVAFLINGLVLPAIKDALTQIHYGDSKIATYDLAGKHWITQEDNGRVRIVMSNEDGSHSQQLTLPLVNAPKHALVTLKENGAHVDVSVNDAYVTYLVSDGSGGYKWGVS